MTRILIFCVWIFASYDAVGESCAPIKVERVFEKTFESQKAYADPFNDVDVDVIVRRADRTWRVPTFWRGNGRWTVRFSLPEPGLYSYVLESTDRSNGDLNGHPGEFELTPYLGSNTLLLHGPLRVSSSKRYFEHADGTPFYWLGDTWWAGLSDRLSWDGFKRLTSDRKKKGFTLIQTVVGFVPLETSPTDAGSCNEGGCAWDPALKQINPGYFDFADRRIQWLIDNELVPAIFGAWAQALPRMGIEKMKKHWRYIIARYGAYPVVWSVAGETSDSSQLAGDRVPNSMRSLVVPGWTDVARYVRQVDPYKHPLTAHELPPPLDHPLQEEAVSDFDLIQSSQFGWPSLAFSVIQLNTRYMRVGGIKPVVQGEMGYENHYYRHFADYQRAAFWLSMLNGAAGYTYGAEATWSAYSPDQPLPTTLFSFLTWEEGMNLPGSYQIGVSAGLLRNYEWWRFEPHPEWLTPRGTTYLDEKSSAAARSWMSWWLDDKTQRGYFDLKYPPENETKRVGVFDRPYAAGIPNEVRIVYIPIRRDSAISEEPPPTVLGLEPGVCYAASIVEGQLGIRIDLGTVKRKKDEPWWIHDYSQSSRPSSNMWDDSQVIESTAEGKAKAMLRTLKNISESNVVIEADIPSSDGTVSVIARYHDPENYVAAVYSAKERELYLIDRTKGIERRRIGTTPTLITGTSFRLSLEVQGKVAAASITDGVHSFTSPIVPIVATGTGRIGFAHTGERDRDIRILKEFRMRRSSPRGMHESFRTKLYDAQGKFRGDLSKSKYWASFQQDQHILLDAYRLERLPTPGDWVLVLDATRTGLRC